MNNTEEPAYLAFARANTRDGMPSGVEIVRGLLARIDSDAARPVALPDRDKLRDLILEGGWRSSEDVADEIIAEFRKVNS